jgi:hypothetical protein
MARTAAEKKAADIAANDAKIAALDAKINASGGVDDQFAKVAKLQATVEQREKSLNKAKVALEKAQSPSAGLEAKRAELVEVGKWLASRPVPGENEPVQDALFEQADEDDDDAV